MNILVTGGNGQLGTCLKNVSEGSSDRYLFTDIDDLDISDKDAVNQFIKENDIDVVINCAAYTNVDKAEEPEELKTVEKVNREAVSILADACKENGALLIHISTDYVFGGNINNTPCDESQEPNPTGVYGRTKLEGEEAIKRSGCDYIILRTAWLYSEYGRNFVKTMINLIGSKENLKVVVDQCGTPTYAGDLAEAIVDIIENRKFVGNKGLYHYSNEGVCSWFDFAKTIQHNMDNNTCRIDPCRSSEFPSKVIRPAYSVLDKSKYKKIFDKEVPYWTDSLKICMDNLNSK